MSSAVATLPDSPIATGVATSAVRGWNGMVAGADGSGGRNWRTVENEEYAVRLRHDFSHADSWASTSTCKDQCIVCISMGISGRSLEIARAAASPSMTGMARSRMMRSGSSPGLWL